MPLLFGNRDTSERDRDRHRLTRSQPGSVRQGTQKKSKRKSPPQDQVDAETGSHSQAEGSTKDSIVGSPTSTEEHVEHVFPDPPPVVVSSGNGSGSHGQDRQTMLSEATIRFEPYVAHPTTTTTEGGDHGETQAQAPQQQQQQRRQLPPPPLAEESAFLPLPLETAHGKRHNHEGRVPENPETEDILVRARRQVAIAVEAERAADRAAETARIAVREARRLMGELERQIQIDHERALARKQEAELLARDAGGLGKYDEE